MADKKKNNNTGTNLGFEDKLWAAADKLRGNMDAAEYKHVVLGLIFLKYISDAFLEKRAELEKKTADPTSEWYVKDENARARIRALVACCGNSGIRPTCSNAPPSWSLSKRKCFAAIGRRSLPIRRYLTLQLADP